MSITKMKILILGGFLGAGKTTALMKLAKYLVRRDPAGLQEERVEVMILENEIGAVGIDDVFLRSGGFAVDTLFAGCACCTMSGELVSAARSIEREYNPKWLLIETTGVAYPRNMQENLSHALGVRARIAVLTDASRWKRLLRPMNDLLRGQIEGSDAVLVNKTDLVSEAELAELEQDVKDFEPNASIYRISAANEVPDDVWRRVAGE